MLVIPSQESGTDITYSLIVMLEERSTTVYALVSLAVCLYSFRNGTACWKDEAPGRFEVEPVTVKMED